MRVRLSLFAALVLFFAPQEAWVWGHTGPGNITGEIMTVDRAFKSLQVAIKGMTGQRDDKSIFSYAWISKIAVWKDSTKYMFQADEPVVNLGKSILLRPDTPAVGTKVIHGSKSNLTENGRYWIFSWHQHGVIEHSCSFFVNAESGTLEYALTYTSPD